MQGEFHISFRYSPWAAMLLYTHTACSPYAFSSCYRLYSRKRMTWFYGSINISITSIFSWAAMLERIQRSSIWGLRSYLNVEVATFVELGEQAREVVLTHPLDVLVAVPIEVGSDVGQVQLHFIGSHVVGHKVVLHNLQLVCLKSGTYVVAVVRNQRWTDLCQQLG